MKLPKIPKKLIIQVVIGIILLIPIIYVLKQLFVMLIYIGMLVISISTSPKDICSSYEESIRPGCLALNGTIIPLPNEGSGAQVTIKYKPSFLDNDPTWKGISETNKSHNEFSMEIIPHFMLPVGKKLYVISYIVSKSIPTELQNNYRNEYHTYLGLFQLPDSSKDSLIYKDSVLLGNDLRSWKWFTYYDKEHMEKKGILEPKTDGSISVSYYNEIDSVITLVFRVQGNKLEKVR